MKPRPVLVFLQRVLPRSYASCVSRGGLSNKAHDKILTEPAALEVRREIRQELLRGHGSTGPIHEDPTANVFEPFILSINNEAGPSRVPFGAVLPPPPP
jgi:hypothetical protein